MPETTDSTFESHSVDQTRRFGRRLGESAEPDTVMALIGPLGAGKTQLVKGIAVGLGIDDERRITSPTFVILKEHRGGRLRLYHVDVYRVESADLSAIGFEEACTSGGLVAVEWAEKIGDLLPEDTLSISFEPTGPEQRRLHCSAFGERSARLLAAARAAT